MAKFWSDAVSDVQDINDGSLITWDSSSAVITSLEDNVVITVSASLQLLTNAAMTLYALLNSTSNDTESYLLAVGGGVGGSDYAYGILSFQTLLKQDDYICLKAYINDPTGAPQNGRLLISAVKR